jgi:antitoxin YefM
MTETISATAARQNLYGLIREVNADHTVKRITSQGGNAVIMAEEDWDSWQETAYLMRSPANAERLLASIEEDRAQTPGIVLTEEQWAALAKAAE